MKTLRLITVIAVLMVIPVLILIMVLIVFKGNAYVETTRWVQIVVYSWGYVLAILGLVWLFLQRKEIFKNLKGFIETGDKF